MSRYDLGEVTSTRVAMAKRVDIARSHRHGSWNGCASHSQCCGGRPKQGCCHEARQTREWPLGMTLHYGELRALTRRHAQLAAAMTIAAPQKPIKTTSDRNALRASLRLPQDSALERKLANKLCCFCGSASLQPAHKVNGRVTTYLLRLSAVHLRMELYAQVKQRFQPALPAKLHCLDDICCRAVSSLSHQPVRRCQSLQSS